MDYSEIVYRLEELSAEMYRDNRYSSSYDTVTIDEAVKLIRFLVEYQEQQDDEIERLKNLLSNKEN